MIPKLLFDNWSKGKHSQILKKKLGKDFSSIKEQNPLVWIHAVSMGETKAIWKFAQLLKEKYPLVNLLITSVTDTGYAEAKRSLPFAKHCYLPFDFSWIIYPIVKRLKPDLVILSETDHWYHFLQAAKESGASTAVINGKLSTRSQARYRLLGPFLDTFFSPIDLFCVQNHLYKERITQLGIKPNKIVVTGNLKFDSPPEKMTQGELEDFRKQLHIQVEDFVIVAGSTHDEEENLILTAILKLSAFFPHIKVIFVPRHPERFSRVEELLKHSPLGCCKLSASHLSNGSEKAILIDAMGQLKKCYQLGNLAIVGGSFVSHVGGHNILEPSFYGVPVIFGPYMHTQTELESLILNAKAGIQSTRETLLPILHDIMESKEKLHSYSQAGKALTDTLQGTSLKTLQVLEEKFNLSQRFSLRKKEALY